MHYGIGELVVVGRDFCVIYFWFTRLQHHELLQINVAALVVNRLSQSAAQL